MNLRAASLSDSLVKPNSHRAFVICEEPAAKAAKKTYGVLDGVFGGIAR